MSLLPSANEAAIAQQATNCLTEIFFEDAIARAKQLDVYIARTGKPVGPLHGLPISLKDTFKVKGYDASIGVATFCFKPAKTNSALVDLLLSLGAVLYCKTKCRFISTRNKESCSLLNAILGPADYDGVG